MAPGSELSRAGHNVSGLVSCEEVSAVLYAHPQWDDGATVRAISHMQHLEKLMSMGQSPLPILTHKELYDNQSLDPIISRVMFFVDRGRRPSRRERVLEAKETVYTLRQWGKLTTWLEILYRV